MKLANLVRIMLLIFPWLTFSFIPKKSLKTFLPVSFFASLLVLGMYFFAWSNKWWTVKGGVKYKLFNDLSFVFGPFFVGTIWIFHYTFGKFKLYFLTNLFIDFLFAYPINFILQRLRLYRLVNFSSNYILIFFTCFSLLIYGFQLIYQRIRN